MSGMTSALRAAIAQNTVYAVALDKPLYQPVSTASALMARSVVEPVLLDLSGYSKSTVVGGILSCAGTATFVFPQAGSADMQISGVAIYLDEALTKLFVANEIDNGPFVLTYPDGVLICPYAIGVGDRSSE